MNTGYQGLLGEGVGRVATLLPEALVFEGRQGGEEEPLVESVENLTSMLEWVQNLNLAYDWIII